MAVILAGLSTFVSFVTAVRLSIALKRNDCIICVLEEAKIIN
jgi:hypothetical protein